MLTHRLHWTCVNKVQWGHLLEESSECCHSHYESSFDSHEYLLKSRNPAVRELSIEQSVGSSALFSDCKMWWVSKWRFTVSGYSSEQYWSDSKHDTTLRSTLSTLSCDLHKWISYSKVAHTLMLMTLGALVSSAVVSVLNKELLCLFLVSPSRWLPSQQTSSSLPVTLRRAVIYDCFSLIIRELSAATLQLSAALHTCGSFPKDFGLITVCLWQRAKRLQSRASLCGSHPVKSELFSLQTEGVLNTQGGRRNETVSTKIKRMKSSKRRQCSFHFTTSPFLSSFAVNREPAAAVSFHRWLLAGRKMIDHQLKREQWDVVGTAGVNNSRWIKNNSHWGGGSSITAAIRNKCSYFLNKCVIDRSVKTKSNKILFSRVFFSLQFSDQPTDMNQKWKHSFSKKLLDRRSEWRGALSSYNRTNLF